MLPTESQGKGTRESGKEQNVLGKEEVVVVVWSESGRGGGESWDLLLGQGHATMRRERGCKVNFPTFICRQFSVIP